MKRFIIAFSLAALGLLAGSVGSTSATDYSVSLGCSDGTQFTETLSAAAAADLADAVTAINTHPAGVPPLICTLSTTPLSGSGAQAAGGAHDFAVGGGQWYVNGAPCELANFGLSAHVDSNSTSGTDGAGGTFNLTIQQQGQCLPGHLTAKVDCLVVTGAGNVGELRAIVQNSSGQFSALTPDTSLLVEATDNKPNTDTLHAEPGGSGGCNSSFTTRNQILRGNINVHVGDSDVDSFSDRVESSAGTDPLAKCPNGPTHDAWPADINNDGFSDITDVSALTADFGKAVPAAPPRYDVAPDPPDGFVDITDVSRVTGLFGTSCVQ